MCYYIQLKFYTKIYYHFFRIKVYNIIYIFTLTYF